MKNKESLLSYFGKRIVPMDTRKRALAIAMGMLTLFVSSDAIDKIYATTTSDIPNTGIEFLDGELKEPTKIERDYEGIWSGDYSQDEITNEFSRHGDVEIGIVRRKGVPINYHIIRFWPNSNLYRSQTLFDRYWRVYTVIVYDEQAKEINRLNIDKNGKLTPVIESSNAEKGER